MGNIIKNDEFQKGLQELLSNKKFKRTLKIIYKENKNQILSVQSCQIIDEPLTIKQHLEQSDGMPIIFEHKCKILLDIGEQKRYYRSCTICNKKIKYDRHVNFCTKCQQETQNKLAYSLQVKIVDMISQDNQETYSAIMFNEAFKYLDIQVNDFSNMCLESQNNYLKNINEQKSHIVHLLKLEYNQERKDFIIKEILPQNTQ